MITFKLSKAVRSLSSLKYFLPSYILIVVMVFFIIICFMVQLFGVRLTGNILNLSICYKIKLFFSLIIPSGIKKLLYALNLKYLTLIFWCDLKFTKHDNQCTNALLIYFFLKWHQFHGEWPVSPQLIYYSSLAQNSTSCCNNRLLRSIKYRGVKVSNEMLINLTKYFSTYFSIVKQCKKNLIDSILNNLINLR